MKITLLLFSVVLFFTSCISNKKKSSNYLDLAQTYFKNQDYKKADSICTLSILNDSANVRAFILKAEIKNKLSNFDEAITILKSILQHGKSLDTIYYLLGDYNFSIAWKENRKVKGKNLGVEKMYWNLSNEYYDSCIKHNPYYYKAYINKGKVFHNIDEYEKSMVILNTAISIFPDSLELIYHRGVEKQFLGDNLGALQDLRSTIASKRLDSADVATAYRYMSFIYSDDKKYDSAIAILTTAIKFNMKDEILYAVRGDLYIKINKKDSACKDFRQAADLGAIFTYKKIQEFCQ